MKTMIRGAAATILTLGLGTAAASAESLWLYERNAAAPQTAGQFYVEPGVGGGIQKLPRFNSTLHFFRPSGGALLSVGSFDPDLRFVQPGGTIGFLMRDGTLPPWLGTRARVFLSGSYTTGWVTGTSTNQDIRTTDGASIAGIGGRVLFANVVGGGAGLRLDETLRVQRDAFELRLGFASDIVINPNLTWSPRIAVFGGRSHDKYSYFGDLSNAAGAHTVLAIEERLRTTEFGGELGASIAWMFHPGFTVNAGASAGAVYLRSRLSGTDCLGGSLTIAPSCGPGLAIFVPGSSVSASGSTVGFRGGASLGLSVDMRFGVLTFGGLFRYDSRIPGIANPQLATQQATGTANATARVRFDDGFTYGGFLRLSVPLRDLGL